VNKEDTTMANQRYEEQPRSQGHTGPSGGRCEACGAELRGRPAGSYGLDGFERGYNQGGFDSANYEEGYTPRSYDRMLSITEGYRGYSDEDTGYENLEGWGSEQGYRGAGPTVPTEQRVPRRPSGKAPRGYQRSDERIREDICERLIDSPYDASEVDVQVKDGEVTLEGTVHDRDDRRAIEDLAAAVRGVFDVHNRIRVLHS
jgi:hypothetical protein